jgi:hypothetical protein
MTRILVVEKGRTTETLLRSWGFEARTALSPVTAAREFRPDAVLVDLASSGLEPGQLCGLRGALLVAMVDPGEAWVGGFHAFFIKAHGPVGLRRLLERWLGQSL